VGYLVEPGTVVDYLRGRGVVSGDAAPRVESLAGGISNDVLAVRGDGVDVVVKQALPKLRVQQDWRAPVTRILAEAAALRLAGALAPGTAPAVLDVDEHNMVLTISRAPDTLRNYKTDLLAGAVDPTTAQALGRALGRWHSATADDAAVRRDFPDQAFIELRIAPYYGRISEVHPDLKPTVTDAAQTMLGTKRCLVHGDFSPKNVLADGAAICVLDWEVAHYGDPVFDLGFLQTHLMLKSIHRPQDTAAYHASWRAFHTEYNASGLDVDDAYLALHTGCLLLARVDGKSPVEYLDAPTQSRVRELAVDLIGHPTPLPWSAIDE
jgi:5-methylthioribose kinase